jgi:hypothetical protein
MGTKNTVNQELNKALIELGFRFDPRMKFYSLDFANVDISSGDFVPQVIFLFAPQTVSFETAIAACGKNTFDRTVPTSIRKAYQQLAQDLMSRMDALNLTLETQKASNQ